jgi:hypothetical protein
LTWGNEKRDERQRHQNLGADDGDDGGGNGGAGKVNGGALKAGWHFV